MSHQDDLATEYKAASNEQPSDLTDQLILKAAADALEEPKGTVIKGKFSSRRWQMPVSLAAAAVITVSVVSTLKPWSVSVVVDETIYQPTASPVESKSAEDFQLEQKADAMANKKKAIAKRERRLSAAPAASAARERALAESVARVEAESMSLMQEADKELTFADAEDSVIQPSLLTIEQWFDVIEKLITDNKTKLAKVEMTLLLKQHPLQSFTDSQQLRYQMIQQQLKVSELKQ